MRAFLDSHGTRLPPVEQAAWAKAVAAAVTQRYFELSKTSLETVRNDEQARLRLSIKPAAGAESVSDSHKICVQLCLDVHAFASELEDVGVSAKELPEYAQLQEAVRPDEGVVGSLGGQKEVAVS